MPASRRAVPPKCFRISAPPLPAQPVACAILDPTIASRPWASSFPNVKETKMTMSLEMQIEELKAELRNACDPVERRQIAAELEMMQAELAAIEAEQDGRVSAEPPF
uniref:Uncharacterized protein n=2 Tax=Rhizobium/Agrobacterium group TaxID=227290 RepID=A0A2Z2PZI5_AGRTU|nr:hypothetical protein [Agrobacterium radiobacter]